MKKLLRHIVPVGLKIKLHRWLQEKQRDFKSPKMLWGYLNASGDWRPRTRISDTVYFYHPERINIADNVFVWHYTILDGMGTLEIEEGAQIGAWVGIFTHSSHIAIRLYGNHYSEVAENNKKGYPISKVKIGAYTFIGAGAKILPGVTIGKGALVGAGAIVSKNVNDFQVVSGNPAEIIGDTRKLDAKYLKDPQLRDWYEEWQKNLKTFL